MANKYITIIIIFIRGFGLLNLLSTARFRDGIFYWPIYEFSFAKVHFFLTDNVRLFSLNVVA